MTKGFCIELPGRGFDLHFASYATEDDLKTYGYHYRLQCRGDFIDALKRCGRVPFLSLEEAITLIEQSRDTQVELNENREIIDTLKKGAEESQEKVKTEQERVETLEK